MLVSEERVVDTPSELEVRVEGAPEAAAEAALVIVEVSMFASVFNPLRTLATLVLLIRLALPSIRPAENWSVKDAVALPRPPMLPRILPRLMRLVRLLRSMPPVVLKML